MSAPYMPLYIADYLADTTHLTRSEHGAYLLLLMAMWRGGGKLPTDDVKLARLTKCTGEEWADMREVILDFFKRRGGIMTHKRLSAEYAKYENTLKRKSEGGKASAAKKAKQNNEKATNIPDDKPQDIATNQNHNQNHKELDGGGSVRDELGWPLSKGEWVDILTAETLCGDIGRDLWLRKTSQVLVGWHQTDRFHWDDVVAGVKAGMVGKANDPPSSWKYFSQPIARAKRDRETPTPEAKSNERRSPNYKTAAERGQDSTISAFGRVFADLATGETDAGRTVEPAEPLRIAGAG